MIVDSSFHLTYCSNIHPGENWKVTFKSLKENLPRIKRNLLPNANFGLGLRLSNLASEELNEGSNLAEFKKWLNENGLYIFTMNGFPYGNFHDTRVKDDVHSPDWTTQERLEYTLRLFEQLGELIPSEVEGGISTSPISYKHWFNTESEKKKAFDVGAQNMISVALKLHQVEAETGKYLHLDIEPEPDGLLENTEEVLHFYEQFLIPVGKEAFGKIGLSSIEAEGLVKRYITVCYDICHFSLAFEEPEHTFMKLTEAGIKIGKIQISAALKIVFVEGKENQLWKALEAFDEPTYLHQVTERKDAKVMTFSDLPEVLSKKNPFEELRAHFHVPVFLEDFGLLKSTQDHIVKTLDFLKSNTQLTDHLEVETYTWEVLPPSLKVPLVDSVVRELNWVKERMV